MAHTSGPWDQIGTEEISKTFVVWRSNYNDATDTRIIARGIDFEDDARLIAAAPDLLEALKAMVNAVMSDVDALIPAQRIALAAITKAIGSD